MILCNSNLKVIPKFIRLCLFLLAVTLVGCVGSMQTMQTENEETAATTETEESSPPLAELQLSTP